MKREILLIISLLLLYSCGGSSSSVSLPPGPGGGGGTIGGPATITVAVSPSTITVLGTATVTATVLDKDGLTVPDGTIVQFSLSDAGKGTITAQATTSSGNAVATFTAARTPGTVTVTASSGGVSGAADIAIAAAAAGSIEFVSANPQVIGIKGTGQQETSTITFIVKDVNGNPVNGKAVSFQINGPGGGEYILPTLASTDADGHAVTLLHSGSVAGPVTVTASVEVSGNTLSTSSAVISIGGSLPSATHYNLATTKYNLAGLVVSGATADITSFIADRFGNFNVLTGTSVSYYAEAGAIDRSALTNDQGLAATSFRTQAPAPASVKPLSWENALCTYLNTTYGLSTSSGGKCSGGHPRNGWTTELSTVQGEEAFLDENGNGLFDESYSASACIKGYTCECDTGGYVTGAVACSSGNRSEAFKDLGEPFIDKNDDGCRNDGANRNCSNVISASTDPFEEFIDVNTNGAYDGPNGVWDGPGCKGAGCQQSKMIWQDITLAFTGNPAFCAVSSTGVDIKYGASHDFKFAVGDKNLNALISGTTINVTSSAGATLSGQTSFAIADGLPQGPAEISFTLTAPVCATPPCAELPYAITITVTPPAPVVSCQPVVISGKFIN